MRYIFSIYYINSIFQNIFKTCSWCYYYIIYAIIEGKIVSPDIEVVDRPEQLAKGIDPCLEKAVEVLLRELKENPVKKIIEPTPPDRSKWHEE